MDRSESLVELTAALVKAQGKIEPATKDKRNTHFGNTYADLAGVWEACRGPLTENGLSIVQTPELIEGIGLGLRTTLLHVSGQYVSSVLPLAFAAGNMQAMGSALTYARRYGIGAMVGVVADEDDDGNLATTVKRAADLPSPPDRQPRHDAPTAANGPVQWGQYGPPKTGRHLYGWAKEHDAIGMVARIARDLGHDPKQLTKLDDATVADIVQVIEDKALEESVP